MKRQILLIIILTFSTINISFACMCSILSTPTVQYQEADFVATIKILKNYKNSPDTNQYYKADIEILELYKGKKIKSIFVLGSNGNNTYNSCGTFISEGETRLIFGRSEGSIISTYLCTSYYKPNNLSFKINKIEEKLILLKKHAKNNVINFSNEIAIYPYDFKRIYNPESTNYYSLVKVVISKGGFVKNIKFITNDTQTLQTAYRDYFSKTIDWQSRLQKISVKNIAEDMTLIFEINPYTKARI